jgi:hypothetical protein
MRDETKTPLIADLLAIAGFDLSAADGSETKSIVHAVEVLKAAVPFMLPVRIVTGHRPAIDIVRENASEQYAGTLLHWVRIFAANPNPDMGHLTTLICLVRRFLMEQIAIVWEERRPVVPGMRRKRANDECDLCDEIMIRWLGQADHIHVNALAIRWDRRSQQRDNNRSGLDELGLTDDALLALPEEEIIRLNQVERLEEESRRDSAECLEFFVSDPVCIELLRWLHDAIDATINR